MAYQSDRMEELKISCRNWKISALIAWLLLAFVGAMSGGLLLSQWQQLQHADLAVNQVVKQENQLLLEAEGKWMQAEKARQKAQDELEQANESLRRVREQTRRLLDSSDLGKARKKWEQGSIPREELLKFRDLFR